MATHSFGITFSYDADTNVGGSPTYVALGEVSDITPPSISKDVIDTTHHGSTGGVRTFVGGLVDNGEMSVTVNYDPATASQTALRDLAKTANTGAVSAFKIAYNNTDASTLEFDGIVTGFEQSTPIDDVIKATITIKVSGQITYTV